MSINESTAMARAHAARAKFPKGPITIAQAQQMVMDMAASQVGYASGSSTRSLYGKRKNWPKGSWSTSQAEAQNFWCYRGLSWVFTMCFGRDATIAGIGHQGHFPFPGWAATWLGMAWMKARGMGVSIQNARPGDLSFQSWGRTGNATDHIEIVTGTWNGSYLPHTGFNTSSGSGSVTTGATVARVWRPGWPIRFIGRPNWAAIVATYNADIAGEVIEDLTEVHKHLSWLGFPATPAGVKQFQTKHGLVADGIPGPITKKKLEAVVASEFEKLENLINSLRGERTNAHKKTTAELAAVRAEQDRQKDQLNVVGRIAREAREGVKGVPDAVAARQSQGLGGDYWLRGGAVLDPKHPQFPADPGSPADVLYRIGEAILGEPIEPYDGTQKRARKSNAHTEEQA